MNLLRHLNFRAVVLGSAATFLFDLMSGMALLFTFGQGMFLPDMTETETRAAIAVLAQTPSFLFTSMLVGSLTTVAGGYIAAVMARRLPYMNAAAVGALGIVIGIVLYDGSAPLWFTVLAFAINIPAALVGGHLAKRKLDGVR